MNAKLTPEELNQIDAALTAFKGNRRLAAESLGMDPARVYAAARDNPALNVKWAVRHAEPPEAGAASELHRGEPGLTPDAKFAQAAAAEDALVEQNGPKLPGISKKKQKEWAAILTTYAGGYKYALDGAHAGVSHTIPHLVFLFNDVTLKIADIEANPEKYTRTSVGQFGENITKLPADYYKEYADLLVRIGDTMRKLHATVEAGTVMRLKARQMEKDQTEKSTKKVAGWKPGEVIEA